MITITQQARRILTNYRAHDRERTMVPRLSARANGSVDIQPAPITTEDAVFSDANGPLLAIDASASQLGSEGMILHYRTDADLGDAPVGWVLLNARQGRPRAGLSAVSAADNASMQTPHRGPVLRVVRAILQALRSRVTVA